MIEKLKNLFQKKQNFHEIYIAILEKIRRKVKNKKNLNEYEKTFYYSDFLYGEVNSGGFYAFFDYEKDKDIKEIKIALENLKDYKTLELLNTAEKMYKKSKKENDLYNKLDNKFYCLNNKLSKNYYLENYDKF